jgi:malate dehydrogenase
MKISIIGAAGIVGSCAAFSIATNKITDELVMIDDFSRDKLEGYVTDLTTALVGMDTQARAGSYEDMRGSNIVVVAAGSSQVVASRLEVLPQNLPIVSEISSKIKQYCPEAVIITASNPVDPLNYAMYLCCGLDRKQCLGYSINDSVRFRMFMAEALKTRSSRVEATVVGEHGASQVLLFSSVRVDGKPVKVSPEIEQWVRGQIAGLPKLMESQRIKTGRTQGWSTSMGLTRLCRAISQDTREILPASVVLNGEYGYRNISISVPVMVGKDGLHQITEWKLSLAEQQGLANSVASLRPTMGIAEEFMAKKK